MSKNNDPPFQLPANHDSFGQLVHASWTTVDAAKRSYKILTALLAVGAIAVVVGLVLWLVMNLMIAGLCTLGAGVIAAGIAGIMYADYACYPPAIAGAYENGICIANVNGIVYESTLDKICNAKFQEFYGHRFAEMELMGHLKPPGGKKVLINKNCQGQPQKLIRYLESKGIIRIETWQEVLARTGG